MDKEQKEISKKIVDAISKVEIVVCTICGSFLSSSEAKKFEGVCSKHWDE